MDPSTLTVQMTVFILNYASQKQQVKFYIFLDSTRLAIQLLVIKHTWYS